MARCACALNFDVMRFLAQPVLCCAILAFVAAPDSYAIPALSATPGQTPIIRSWRTEAGLPQNSVNAIVQSRDGYLWLGTQDGLARFDGVRFKSFDFKDGLPGVRINVLLEDHEGTLWIGTDGSGLCCMKHGRIQAILGSDNQPGSDTITCLVEDGRGQIWAGTSGGLRICRDGKLEGDSAFGNLRRAPILGLLRSRDGSTIWIASSTYGLFSYQDHKLEPCVGPPEHEKVIGECLFEDRNENLWVGIGNGVVLRHDKKQWQIFSETNGLPFAFITCMTEDSDGTVWAGSLDAGLYRFDGSFFNLVSQKDGLSADDIRSLACDREGNLWIGTRTGGLDRMSRRRLSVVSNAQGLTNDFTHSVAQTPDGTLWVGTTGGAMYSGGPGGFKPFRQANDDRVYFYATVFPVLTATDGSLWWGAHNGLLHWQTDRLVDCVTNGPWIQDTTVTALQNDLRGGMWIGTTAGHLLHLHDHQFDEFPEHITRATISSLAVQTNGDVWVGTMASGLKFVPAGNDHAFSFTNGLSSKASVYTLYLDHEGILWIGTEGGGLSCLRDGKIFNFTASQGLPPPTVMQIIEDNHHFLWLGCRRGIFRVSKVDLLDCAGGKISFVRSRSFGINDGMLTEECSGGYCPAGLKTESGLICISTVKGLVFIDPDQVNDEIPPPTVLLEEALISGKEQRFEAEDSSEIDPLSGVPSRPRLVIVPGPRDLELHYSAIGFSAPEKIGFRYKLDPLDSDWKTAGPERMFSYPHLPPGNFTLHIQACNANGLWNGQDTTLAVIALPFFWETSWFHGVAIFILFGLVSGIVAAVLRNRYKMRLARLQALNAIERERLRISKDMHDQVGSVLTQVSQLTDMGLNETGDQELVKKRFDRIGNRARLAVQSLDEIVWATNPKNDNLASFAEYVSRFSDEFFEYTNVRCWQDMPHTIPAMPLRAEIRHNVFLAVREALNNALKHSKCAEIWLKMKINDGEASLKIEDNGAGFTPAHTHAGGNGLGNMEARLTECGGRVEFSSTPGKGTSVTFIFPIK